MENVQLKSSKKLFTSIVVAVEKKNTKNCTQFRYRESEKKRRTIVVELCKFIKLHFTLIVAA